MGRIKQAEDESVTGYLGGELDAVFTEGKECPSVFVLLLQAEGEWAVHKFTGPDASSAAHNPWCRLQPPVQDHHWKVAPVRLGKRYATSPNGNDACDGATG
jgi:hypothetical protein